MWQLIENEIAQQLNLPFFIESTTSIDGGDINQAYLLTGVVHNNEQIKFFVKVNAIEQLDIFEAEAFSLTHLEKSHTIQTPKVICYGTSKNYSFSFYSG